MTDGILLALVVALTVVSVVAVQMIWQWWSEATLRQRRALVKEAARWVVDAAELLHAQPGSGATKLAWVLERLAKRFPEFDEQILARHVEKAVHDLNANKAAEAMARLNGKGPKGDK
ncbi:MAG: hypothetical protein E6Q97_14250 [Desulfurellales bacterium]|nr:MAG: hypothetical protein E6Q97_14250 [Desulfurellales bacterium]